MIKTDDYLF